MTLTSTLTTYAKVLLLDITEECFNRAFFMTKKTIVTFLSYVFVLSVIIESLLKLILCIFNTAWHVYVYMIRSVHGPTIIGHNLIAFRNSFRR